LSTESSVDDIISPSGHARVHPGGALMSGRLEGIRAVVVGAGQSDGQALGFGRAISVLFAREGASLLLVDRESGRLEHTVEAIHADLPGARSSVSTCIADIVDAAQVDRVAVQADTTLGGVDVLVNNVGILGLGAVTALAEDVWDRVLDVNLKGMWLMSRAVIPLMVRGQRGSVINMSSIGAYRGVSPAYCSSKAGVNALTRAIATGYGADGIRANAILPGHIETPMAIDGMVAQRGGIREDLVKAAHDRTPLAYKGSAWDIAYAALYLASEESSFVSGIELVVDGAALVAP
jgi:NAD(P)-dependent dehydrogenase (short-subunit alcohol dehydrogenase family)